MTLKNNYWITLCSAFMALCLYTACTGKSEKAPADDEAMTLSANDTTEVIDLMRQYLDLLSNKDFDGAMAMLHQLRNDSLVPMDSVVKKHYDVGMKLMVPLRYELESMIFETESVCLVKYSAVLFDKEDEKDNRPNKMFYAVRPVRLDGKWYLTVSDKNDMNTRDSKIQL